MWLVGSKPIRSNDTIQTTSFPPFFVHYRIYSINRLGAFIKYLDLESGRLFEAGRLLSFPHFQQV